MNFWTILGHNCEGMVSLKNIVKCQQIRKIEYLMSFENYILLSKLSMWRPKRFLANLGALESGLTIALVEKYSSFCPFF